MSSTTKSHAQCELGLGVWKAQRNTRRLDGEDGGQGLHVAKDDVHGFMCAWHCINHYLGTPEKWLLPKNGDVVEAVWNAQRDKEWKKTDDGVYMTAQASKFHQDLIGPGASDAYIALTRVALTEKYADMAGVPKNPLDLAGKALAAGRRWPARNGPRPLLARRPRPV
ncbi:hypothetical protein [Streptomyces africanus]|uniref:hypothetical protein n=1 Tax=Streptomyces africanus TaxID=231024 RepID=UPI001ABFAA66|nr:hypothetical protein [Streptomyces africanus]